MNIKTNNNNADDGDGGGSSSDSDYLVEKFVRPNKISVPLTNDESGDLLGNFDDAKRKRIYEKYGDVSSTESENDSDSEDDSNENENLDDDDDDEDADEEDNNKMSDVQMISLLRGTCKTNRLVLYVTNLTFDTTKEQIMELFSKIGNVKAVRIPNKRKTAFAFVEMNDTESFKNAFSLHNSLFNGKSIKIQLSEGGKKKSANKKNILKQKNRKLAEMRNESKTFTKSGKNYDKVIKKEIAKEKLQKEKIWERRKKKIMIKRAQKAQKSVSSSAPN